MKHNKAISSRAIYEHIKHIFSISQTIPNVIVNLLIQKNKRQLTQKQHRQIYEQFKEKNIFPILTNPKSLIEFCSSLSIEYIQAEKRISPNNFCCIVIDGSIKIFQVIAEQDNLSTFGAINIQQKNPIDSNNQRTTRIEKQKINTGQVLLFEQPLKNLQFISCPSVILLKIPHQMYKHIGMSTYITQLKKKQLFFSQIPLFQKHYRSYLQDFVNNLQQTQFDFGKKVFSQGQSIEKVYIVKEGEFLLQKNITESDMIEFDKFVKYNTLSSQSISCQLKLQNKFIREFTYKIVGPQQIFGDCQYIHNNRRYMNSMKCHKQGSILYSIDVQLYFKKLYALEEGIDRCNAILQQNYMKRKKQIQKKVRFNNSDRLIRKIMQNPSQKQRTFYYSKDQNHSRNKSVSFTPTRTSCQFFQKMNMTIMNQNQNLIRKRNSSKIYDYKSVSKSKKMRKTPAIVEQVVQIVNQKKAYHKLRNLGTQKKGAFQFDINNVPPFIKKKYARLFPGKSK